MADMTDSPDNDPAPTHDDQFSQQVQHRPVSARVTDQVARGVFSTGVLVQTGRHEFILDFLLMVVRPHQVVARIVMPFGVAQGFIHALKQNLDTYTQRFGPPPALPPVPKPEPTPTIEEIYSQIKLPDAMLPGVYANTVMITHSPSEFAFDFIASFYPTSAVACRVFLTVPQIPKFLESLTRSFEQLKKRLEPPPPETSSENAP